MYLLKFRKVIRERLYYFGNFVYNVIEELLSGEFEFLVLVNYQSK